MRTKDRDLFRDEIGRHLLSTFRCIVQAKDLFPRLRPNLSHARLRRAVARLRSGAMQIGRASCRERVSFLV